MKKIRIQEVDVNNWYECCTLELSEEQRGFVDSNAVSLAQSKYEPSLRPLAVYSGEKLVGFAMYNTVREELGAHWIYRIMVDYNHQGRGIGREAMLLVVDEMRKVKGCSKIAVGYLPQNSQAEKLYLSMGFEDEGDVFGREKAVVMRI